jgi:indolepyruvate decarboxylase
MNKTVIQHVVSRPQDIGIKDIFGVARDAFSIHDAICSDRNLRFIGDCNELNAAYAADTNTRARARLPAKWRANL